MKERKFMEFSLADKDLNKNLHQFLKSVIHAKGIYFINFKQFTGYLNPIESKFLLAETTKNPNQFPLLESPWITFTVTMQNGEFSSDCSQTDKMESYAAHLDQIVASFNATIRIEKEAFLEEAITSIGSNASPTPKTSGLFAERLLSAPPYGGIQFVHDIPKLYLTVTKNVLDNTLHPLLQSFLIDSVIEIVKAYLLDELLTEVISKTQNQLWTYKVASEFGKLESQSETKSSWLSSNVNSQKMHNINLARSQFSAEYKKISQITFFKITIKTDYTSHYQVSWSLYQIMDHAKKHNDKVRIACQNLGWVDPDGNLRQDRPLPEAVVDTYNALSDPGHSCSCSSLY